MFNGILYSAYYLVALFYLAAGILLLIYPHLIEVHLKKCFPLLASYRYQRIANSVNLIAIGIGLLIIGNMIVEKEFFGFFVALMLSGLEMYLGIAFYFFEERDLPQAIIHVVLHVILLTAIGVFILHNFSPQIDEFRGQAATALSSLVPWNF